VKYSTFINSNGKLVYSDGGSVMLVVLRWLYGKLYDSKAQHFSILLFFNNLLFNLFIIYLSEKLLVLHPMASDDCPEHSIPCILDGIGDYKNVG